MKKTSSKTNHHGSISWYNMNYWLLNGFLLPGLGYSALCDLVRAGRFKSLDAAILEGIGAIIEENASLLVRTDSKWMHMLNGLKDVNKDPRHEKPDLAGAENVRFLEKMYEAREKAESKR